jgi:hypothetical protein
LTRCYPDALWSSATSTLRGVALKTDSLTVKRKSFTADSAGGRCCCDRATSQIAGFT